MSNYLKRVRAALYNLTGITGDDPLTTKSGKVLSVHADEDRFELVDGGGADRGLLLVDDHEFAEGGSSYVTKASFRHVIDAEKLPTKWRVVAGMWRTGGAGTASLKITIASDTVELTSTDATETLQFGDLTFATIVSDTLYTVTVQLKLTGGGTDARYKYLAIQQVY